MNTCPNCGKMAGLHGSIFQGCMCQYSMQPPVMREGKDFTISKPWVGLTDEEINKLRYKKDWTAPWTDTTFARAIEAKLKEKNTRNGVAYD